MPGRSSDVFPQHDRAEFLLSKNRSFSPAIPVKSTAIPGVITRVRDSELGAHGSWQGVGAKGGGGGSAKPPGHACRAVYLPCWG